MSDQDVLLPKWSPARLENHFGKIPAWSLIYFLNYVYFDKCPVQIILRHPLCSTYMYQCTWVTFIWSIIILPLVPEVADAAPFLSLFVGIYYCINGILLPKLFWPTVRKKCSSDREKLLKFEAESREFAKFLRSLEQFIQTVKGQNNFW